jgi:hypothetical protein
MCENSNVSYHSYLCLAGIVSSTPATSATATPGQTTSPVITPVQSTSARATEGQTTSAATTVTAEFTGGDSIGECPQ